MGIVSLVASGCGGSGSAKTPVSAAARTAGSQTTGSQTTGSSGPRAAVVPAAAPAPHVSILSPRVGAHTSSTITVAVAATGAAGGGAQRFRYVLDRRLTRMGSARLTFHQLVPGRHRVDVFLASNSASHATTTFTVRAPAPVRIPAPVQATPMTARSAPTPPPAEPTTSAAPPPPKAAAPSPSSEGIPQGGGGDGDGDNSGGPSDGDGNR